jgi:hypothetical protein
VGLVWKRDKNRGFWAKRPFLPPWLAAGQRQGRLGRRRPAGLPATAVASERGKRERATRGFPSLTHLGLGRAVEAAPREGSGAAAVLGGGGAVELGERGEGCDKAGSGEVRRPFIGGGRRFGGEIFPTSSTPASSSGFSRRRPVTRRLGQWRQVNSCRPGAARAAVERGRRLAVVLGGDRTAGE